MTRVKEPRILEAQGRKSRQTAKLHQLDVLLSLVNKPLTFSELIKKTKFSKPVLAKHLAYWRDGGMIYKDTIKPNEATNPKHVGKVVYRMITGTLVPEMVAAMETALQLPKPYWSEESRTEFKKHLEGIAQIILDEEDKRMTN